MAIDTLLNAMQVMNPPQAAREQGVERIGNPLDHLRDELEEDRWPTDDDDDEEEEEEEEEEQMPPLIDQQRLNEAAIQRLLQNNNNNDILAAFERELLQNRQAENINNRQEEDEEPLDVGDDMNGVLEAIGLRGNPWMLVQNSVLMSLMISLCLGVAVWIPYVVGRLVIMIRPITFVETPIYLMRLITDPLVDFVLDLVMPFIWTQVKPLVPQQIQSALEGIQTPIQITNGTTEEGVSVIQERLEAMGTVALTRWHGFATGQTGLDRSICILVGYLVLISLGSWYLHGHRRHRRSSGRNNTETLSDMIRQQGIFLKVLFFILIELIVFPTVCGFLLDLATLPLFNGSIESRYGFHLKSPYSSYFLHWFLGTGVLFYFAIFITVCREIIRPGVMWFIRDPNDPQFHPVQEMVERPFPNLLHKISQSALIYSVMLVFGVGTVTYSLGYTGMVFPLRLPFNTPLSTLAIDLLMIQFLMPPLMRLIKPRDYSKKVLDLWWHMACRQLRLTSFMFNERKPDEEGRFVYRTWKAWLTRQVPQLPEDDVAIQEGDVIFQPDGMFLRVPKYDSVPVDPKRRMLVPVDPVSLEALDEQERGRLHPAAADTMDESQSTVVVYAPPRFKQRLIVFLLYMWFSISLLTCSVTVVPLLVGRGLFYYWLAPGSPVNDLYSFGLGIYVMVGIAILIRWIHDAYLTPNMMTYIKDKLTKLAKFCYLSVTLGMWIPFLLGVAVDLFVFMPIRSSNTDTGLVIHVSQNWSFGVAYMSIIHHVIHVLPANNRIRQYYTEFMGDGMMQAHLWNITRSVIVPVTMCALLAISLPAIVSWGMVHMLDTPSLLMMTRYTYPIMFGIIMSLLLGWLGKRLMSLWLQSVRDDTYLIGKRLHNL
ncbi:uncharacterized protein B0P05DRAFT_555187 [Gilbertella persicaria]|uniref:uncharacterized protein n=1 Tax=Gilbertella persicaria TaxID=101096 RepID=UPI00221F7278|nr:uncharacterized protein B0P05DRAFT_555187 [Gilbertella persicaria]KAI8063657.1 hypothetical protein B0P05DRAFT_555187 [Gilbertella persicaria]